MPELWTFQLPWKRRLGDFFRKQHFRHRQLRSLRTCGLWRRWHTYPEIIDVPAGRRILCLAPHMDDEVIGCGGALRKAVSAGSLVEVVYLTDGRYGRTSDSVVKSRQDLCEVRQKEAQRAAAILGVHRCHFLGVEDTTLKVTPEIRQRLFDIIDEFKADSVFLPFFLDEHADHQATTPLLLAATEGAGYGLECYCYEVWTPLYPNTIVDITAVIDQKKAALAAYISQLRDVDYLRTTLGLNAYRAILNGGKGYAEAFWRLPLAELRGLVKEIGS